MANNKTFRVSLDMKAPTAQRNEWEVVEGDNGNIIEITLTDDGEPVDLTGCKVLAVFGLPTGVTVEQDTDEGSVTIGGDDSNVITIALKTGSFSPGKSSSGLMKCEIQVYSGVPQNVLVTSAQFTFRCRRAIINDDTIAATDEYPILVELIESVADVIETVDNKVIDWQNEIDQAFEDRQTDWDEADTSSYAYIKNKPTSMVPTAHASTHAAGGTDEITPADIGAAASGDLADYIPLAQKAAASGVASLESDGHVTPEQTSSPIVYVSANKTLTLADAGTLQQVDSTSNLTITIPANESVAFPVGTEIELVRWNTGTVTVAAASGVGLNSGNGKKKISTRFSCACLKQIATDNWLLAGDLGS